MSEKDKEVIKAVRVIKDYCENRLSREGCDGCIFDDGSTMCPISDRPDFWNLPKEECE